MILSKISPHQDALISRISIKSILLLNNPSVVRLVLISTATILLWRMFCLCHYLSLPESESIFTMIFLYLQEPFRPNIVTSSRFHSTKIFQSPWPGLLYQEIDWYFIHLPVPRLFQYYYFVIWKSNQFFDICCARIFFLQICRWTFFRGFDAAV